MYSKKIVERNLLRAEEIIKKKHDLPLRWNLKIPSKGEREEMRAHFETLLDPKGFLIRDVTDEERLWILVESTIAKLDFTYFSNNYGTIIDWTSRPILVEFNIAQKLILSLIAEYEELGYALMFLFLKARRLGITTLWQLLLAHRVMFYRNVGAYTGSAEQTKSREMVQMIEMIWEYLPWWMKPRMTAYRAGELMQFGDLKSAVVVQWGNQKQGIGRGATPTIAHLSEVSSFEHPEELIDAALAKAILENPFGMLAMESTAMKLGDWLNLTWDYMVKADAKGLAKYKPIFLPWYVGTDLYPTEAGYRRRPAPENWNIPHYVEQHAIAAKVYVDSNRFLKKALGDEWEMSLRQKWWYHLEFEEARERKQMHVFLRELPASAAEAFQNANPSVFTIETMQETRTQSITSFPVGVFQLSGKEVPFIYRDKKIIGDSISLRCLSPDGVLMEEFSLEPVECDGWPDPDPDDKVFIWEWPQAGETYGVWCDPSEGVGRDGSSIGVIKKATPWHPDEQVAEWRSNRVYQHDLWAWMYALCHLYTVRGIDGEWRDPLAAIEVNIGAGDAVQTEMLKRGYTHFYREMDMTQIGETGAQYQKRPRAIRDRMGWRTDVRTRPKMISLFRKMVRDGTFKVRSPFLVREMATLEYNIDKQKIMAIANEYDDRIMGAAMLLTCWYDPELYGNAPHAFVQEREYEQELERMPVYMGDMRIGRGSSYSTPAPPKWDARSLYG